MSQKIPVLNVGLPAGHPAILTHPGAQAPGFDARAVSEKIKIMMQSFGDTRGFPLRRLAFVCLLRLAHWVAYAVEWFFAGPEDDFQRYVDKLKENKWQGMYLVFAPSIIAFGP